MILIRFIYMYSLVDCIYRFVLRIILFKWRKKILEEKSVFLYLKVIVIKGLFEFVVVVDGGVGIVVVGRGILMGFLGR